RRAAVVPQVAEQIHDGRGAHDAHVAEGQITDGADKLLELTGNARALAGVKGVVGSRRKLVDNEVARAREEQLDGDQSLEIDALGAATSDLRSARNERRFERGGHH